VRRDGDAFIVGDDQRVPVSVLVDQARQRPETFSPNVLLRPVVQDTLFPTVCYVAGPNELAYLAQLRGVYDAFGLPMPLMHPRATATLLDPAGTRFLARYRVPLEALAEQNEHALNELLKTCCRRTSKRRSARPSAHRRADGQGHRRGAGHRPDARRAGPLGARPHDARARHAAREGAAGGQAARRDAAAPVPARARAGVSGRTRRRNAPSGSVTFLNRYGPALAARLLEELPLDGGTHWVVTI
jgi:bacillithiol synthase